MRWPTISASAGLQVSGRIVIESSTRSDRSICHARSPLDENAGCRPGPSSPMRPHPGDLEPRRRLLGSLPVDHLAADAGTFLGGGGEHAQSLRHHAISFARSRCVAPELDRRDDAAISFLAHLQMPAMRMRARRLSEAAAIHFASPISSPVDCGPRRYLPPE